MTNNTNSINPNLEDAQMAFEEIDCIDNFKMARRCTIQLPFSSPKLLESYADYFIVGAYSNKPF